MKLAIKGGNMGKKRYKNLSGEDEPINIFSGSLFLKLLFKLISKIF